MSPNIGVAFTLAVVGALLVWFVQKGKNSAPENVVTTDAGLLTPEIGVSNSPSIQGDTWNTPYYLRENYVVDRGGPLSMVMPFIVAGGLPPYFGSQEIPPQF